MLALSDRIRQTVEQAAKVMDEYKQRLSEVLVEEVEKIRQEAEQEAKPTRQRSKP
jgi:Sec-independent protein translocase protein TatA